jgi:acyl carrier protein
MDTRQSVRRFLTENMMMEDGASIPDDASFLAQNLLDSTGVLELVDFLERELGVEIDDSEILPQNLDSLARIAAFIERKQGTHVAAA